VEDPPCAHDHAFIHASDDASVPMELIQREAATAAAHCHLASSSFGTGPFPVRTHPPSGCQDWLPMELATR